MPADDSSPKSSSVMPSSANTVSAWSFSPLGRSLRQALVITIASALVPAASRAFGPAMCGMRLRLHVGELRRRQVHAGLVAGTCRDRGGEANPHHPSDLAESVLPGGVLAEVRVNVRIPQPRRDRRAADIDLNLGRTIRPDRADHSVVDQDAGGVENGRGEIAAEDRADGSE